MRLDALFQPRSIAVIGASEKPTIGRRLMITPLALTVAAVKDAVAG